MRNPIYFALAAVAAACLPSLTSAAETDAKPPLAERYLLEGRLGDGEAALARALQENPKDDQARFGLGATHFLRAVERLVQSFHRHGLRDHGASLSLPFLRLPTPPNPKPEKLTYEGSRQILQNWIGDLGRAETALAEITAADVKLPLRFALIRLDLNGDGRADEDETLWRIYARLNRGAEEKPQKDGLTIGFDRGDVHWLRGYCHLLRALAEIALAHDGKELFDCTAHLFFPKVESPHRFLVEGRRVFSLGGPGGDSDYDAADLIAFIHLLLRLPVKEPKRMAAALTHLEAMTVQSQESWKFILAETDDDHEWIPNPKQTGVIPNVRVTAEMARAWQSFMTELQDILAGKLLVPFWRGSDGRGVNLRRVFTEPRDLDLVLWVQGTAAVPYLEKGTLTNKDVWQRLRRVFGGQFIGFALWFN